MSAAQQPSFFTAQLQPPGFAEAWAEHDQRYGVRVRYDLVAVVAVGDLWTIVIKVRRREIAAVARPLRDAVAFLHEFARDLDFLDERFAARMSDTNA